MVFTVNATNFAQRLHQLMIFAARQSSNVDGTLVRVSRITGRSLYVELISQQVYFATSISVNEDIEEFGTFFVHGKALLDILKSCTDATITLTDEHMHIESNRSSWTLPFVSSSLVPPEREPNLPADCIFATNDFLSAINEVAYAIGGDECQPYLQILSVDDGKFRASDGKRYHEFDSKVSGLNLTMQYPLVKDMKSMLGSPLWADTAEIEFHQESNYYVFVLPGVSALYIAKISVRVPDFDNIVVRPLKTQVPQLLKMSKRDLTSALKKVKLLSDKTSPVVEATLVSGEVTLKCNRRNGSEATTSIPARWSMSPRVVHFNVNDLLELVSTVGHDDLELRLGEDTRERKSPIVLEGDESWSMVTQRQVR
jgi:DNA polymerase III sliding clamp (beta) subunit (PCNA family)